MAGHSDELDPANSTWRLKHMVKHQFETIQTEDRQTRSSAAATEGAVQTTLTLQLDHDRWQIDLAKGGTHSERQLPTMLVC